MNAQPLQGRFLRKHLPVFKRYPRTLCATTPYSDTLTIPAKQLTNSILSNAAEATQCEHFEFEVLKFFVGQTDHGPRDRRHLRVDIQTGTLGVNAQTPRVLTILAPPG